MLKGQARMRLESAETHCVVLALNFLSHWQYSADLVPATFKSAETTEFG